MMKSFAPLLLLIFAFACAPDRSGLNKLMEETMKVHDEAMAKMGDMNRIARTLKEELSIADSLELSQGRRDSITLVLVEMDKAEKDMMDWMANFKEPEVDAKLEEAMKYMQDSKAAIDKNYDDMMNAIEAGEALNKK